MFLSLFTGCGKNKTITDLTKFRLSYSMGSMMNSNVVYELTVQNGEYIAKYKPHMIPEKMTLEIKTDKAFADKLAGIMTEQRIAKWDGFSRSAKNVMDGDSFGFSAQYGDKGSISAHGYMRYPDGYGNFCGATESAFESLFEAIPFYGELGDPEDYKKVDVEALKASYPEVFEFNYDEVPVLVYLIHGKFSLEKEADLPKNRSFVTPKYSFTAAEAKAVINALYHIPCGIEVVAVPNPLLSVAITEKQVEEAKTAVQYYMFRP